MHFLRQVLVLPAQEPDSQRVSDPGTSAREELNLQLDIFSCLALNKDLGGITSTLESLDLAMRPESVFYTCRALRRILLGVCWYPVRVEESSRVNTVPGELHEGPGLIINSAGFYVNQMIQTNSYLRTMFTLEATDHPLHISRQERRDLSALYCHTLTFTPVNHQLMFRIISRYISMSQFEECFSTFMCSIQGHRALEKMCTQNYHNLLSHLKSPILTYIPSFSRDHQIEFYKFNMLAFVGDWPNLQVISHIKEQICINVHRYQEALISLCRLHPNSEVILSTSKLAEFQTLMGMALPEHKVYTYKKDPGAKPFKVSAKIDGIQKWWVYPHQVPIYRATMCMAVMTRIEEDIISHQPGTTTSCHTPTLPQVLVSMFNKTQFAPRESSTTVKIVKEKGQTLPRLSNLVEKSVCDEFSPLHHLSVNGFHINVFNTNMVVNTKITYRQGPNKYRSLLDVPRLINNFVVKKYSVKEPSFTVSVFYSDRSCTGTAINMNISGDFLTFTFAMCNLRCFLPIDTILPISIANWNSTLDLHGLENQKVVRCGRNDVFWTTNFPSAVSSKKGFNVSWFKAATATISKVHGKALVSQVMGETTPILTSGTAQLNPVKNSIFSTLEHRNRTQVQTIHKRFLECLYECSSFLRLSVHTLLRLSREGHFDFLKKIISHTKNKHECAVLGYKKCNLVPKVLCHKKKVRLDELGRNANFMTFASCIGHRNTRLKKQIQRHMLRTFGLSWRLKRHKL
ncbi:hypothetical protein [Rhinolophus gammaherpesvirus 1]|uniref:Herpesvirus UL87 C-terminal domain-containing protein n=1 Tax=Rhinolophus gammaherpesvirus 1 TaxID=2054179 RepID=A0A2Z5U6A7_9GAMA|nr:hypothetical protein [Rhinolophus gammaherpesvirus 1]BBB06473.1 hypothetical protein [Rhinolophus gammaherpesvirus 1]